MRFPIRFLPRVAPSARRAGRGSASVVNNTGGHQHHFISGPALPHLSILMTPVAPFANELLALPRGMQNTLLRMATRAAMSPLRKAAATEIRKATAGSPYSSGLLARNMVIKVSRNKNGLDVTGLVGAKRGVKERVTVYTYVPVGKRSQTSVRHQQTWSYQRRQILRSPTRYLHLFEKGFRHWFGFQVRGRRVLIRTIHQGRGPAIAAFNNSLAKNLPRYIARRFQRVFGVAPP